MANESAGAHEIDFDNMVFVVMPFGAGTVGRINDDRYEQLIERAVRELREESCPELRCQRADRLDQPGIITQQVIEYLSASRIVIADLNGLNPNVFYELGVRHALRYGTILIAPTPTEAQTLPFNISGLRVIFYEDRIGQLKATKNKLKACIRECLEGEPLPDSPVSAPDIDTAKRLLSTGMIKPLAKRLAEALGEDPQWAAMAMSQAGIGPIANTVFGRRLSHFRDEKKAIAKYFVPKLLARCQRLLSGKYKKVYLIVDAGTTLVPVLDELARVAVEYDPEKNKWLSNLRIYTNNLAGVQSMMEHRRPTTTSRFATLPIDCNLFPGRPLPEYSAIVGKETEDAVKDLCRRASEEDGAALIGILLGNWIRLRRTSPQCPIPLARGVDHVKFKQTVTDSVLAAAGEIFVVTPLGKVFCDRSSDEVFAALQSVQEMSSTAEEIDASDDRDYQQLEITNEQARRVKIVATSRCHTDQVLYDLSTRLKGNLHFWRSPTDDEFANANLGDARHLIFDFDELQPVWARQLEQEFPHARTRTERFLEMMYTTPKSPRS